MSVALLTLISGLLVASKGVYNIVNDSFRALSYDKLAIEGPYGFQFLRGCNNGVCDILNIDGTQTGISGLPASLNITRIFSGQELFRTESNGISKYFFQGKLVDIPEKFRNAKLFLDDSKICKDTTIRHKLQQKPSVSSKKKQNMYSLLLQSMDPKNFSFHTSCYDIATRRESIIPKRFSRSIFGIGISDGVFSGDKIGFMYRNGKLIEDSISNCKEDAFLDGSTIIRCESTQYPSPLSKISVFDSTGMKIRSNFGAIFNRYKDISFSAKQDAFGTDSVVISLGKTRIASHPMSSIKVMVGDQGYCIDIDQESTTCLNIQNGSKLKLKSGQYSYVMFSSPMKTDTLCFDVFGRLNYWSLNFINKKNMYPGDWHLKENGFYVAGKNYPKEQFGFLNLMYNSRDSIEVKEFIPSDGNRIERISRYFIIGAE
ncbi:MAG: hypothetical protein IPK50_06395 [Fibrobacterota bacterium]|nr:hypothetical protein [Fibrobacterota bacterium]QQS06521.1 MAG: hypothetical protein IPK50_06395 [Fibrobacterota bacterium]